MNQKIKVLIDQTRLITGHKARGSGTYIKNLTESLEGLGDVELIENYLNKPDLVHFPYFDPFFLTLPAQFENPSVITVHDLIPLDHKEFFPVGIKATLKWKLQKHRLKKARAIITDSEYSKQRITVLTGINEKKIFAIPLAADAIFKILPEKEILPIRKKYLLPKEFILYLGDVNPNKNVIRLVQAAEGFKYPLILAGRAFGGNSKESIEIKRLVKNSANSRIIGEIQQAADLVRIYNAAYLTVVPSWDEGFGFPILESMACGTPVATSSISCLPEVGRDAAIYFNPYSVTDITKKINNAIKLSQNNYSILVKKSLENNQYFTWRKTAKLTLDVYRKILS